MRVSCNGVMTGDDLGCYASDNNRPEAPILNLTPIQQASEALNHTNSASDITSVIQDLCRETGSRMILLRRWSDGLRVLFSVGLEIPSDMALDSDKPTLIHSLKDDLFNLTSREKSVYYGKLNRTTVSQEFLNLVGQGNREAFILPLPTRRNWDTTIYFDWESNSDYAPLLPIIANNALMKLHCLEAGLSLQGAGVSSLMKTENAENNNIEELILSELTPEKVIDMVGELSALPQVASRILSLLSDEKATASDLEAQINLDQVLTGRILSVANSSYYAGNSEIKTVKDAIVRLGFRTIRNWTLAAASRSIILGARKDEVLDSIWRKSVATAISCQVVADVSGLCNREAAFTGGLMQNLGQLVLARALPTQFAGIIETANKEGEPIHAIEKEVIGFDHGQLGGCLITAWDLSDEVAEAVKLHHVGYEYDAPKLARVIALAEELAEIKDNSPEVVEVKHAISENAKILNIDVKTWTRMWEQLSNIDVEC
jgi:HD-like signal output (HDOD) protein